MEKEKFYDDVIAPKLMAIAKECEDNGLSLFAMCEWKPDEFGTTRSFREGSSFALRMTDTASRCKGNLDSFMMAMERYARSNGHSSIYLTMRGIPEKPIYAP